MHDDAGNSAQPACVAQQLAVDLEEPAVDEVVAFDAGKGERIGVGGEVPDALGIG